MLRLAVLRLLCAEQFLAALFCCAQEAGRLRREHAAALMGRAVAPPTPTRRDTAAHATDEDSSDAEDAECGDAWGTPPPVTPA